MTDAELTHQVIGAAIEVHRTLGPGLMESAYEECLARELTLLHIPFERQKALPLVYKDVKLGQQLTCLIQSESVPSEDDGGCVLTPIREQINALEHLARSIRGASYSREELFLMMAAYFDESEVTEFGFMIVAGWLATVAEWQEFEYDWKLFLAKYDVPYLHMKEYSQSVGPFKKWKTKDGTRKNFMRDASGIINTTIQHGFYCFIHNELFNEVDGRYELREKFSSSYALAGRACASMANEWQNEAPLNRKDIKYVFEDGGPDKGGLLNAMDLTPSLPAPIFEPGKNWKPSTKWPNGRTGLVQLQSADYLAYEIGKFARDRQKPNTQRFRASLGVLPEKKVKRLFFTTSKLETLCKMLDIKRRGTIQSTES